jgi:hypothetical protein
MTVAVLVSTVVGFLSGIAVLHRTRGASLLPTTRELLVVLPVLLVL